MFVDKEEALATLEQKLRGIHPTVSVSDITETRQTQAFAINPYLICIKAYIVVEIDDGEKIRLSQKRCRENVLERMEISVCYRCNHEDEYVRCPFSEL